MNKHLHIKSGDEYVDIQLSSGSREKDEAPAMVDALPHLKPQQGGYQYHAEPRTLLGRIAACSVILLILLFLLVALGAIAWFSLMDDWAAM